MQNLSTLMELSPAELSHVIQNIGNTPLKPIRFLLNGNIHVVHLKLESENPTGSMKDRTGWGLIQDLEERGILDEDSTIIESTSGNLGVALALICKMRGYKLIVVVDPKTTEENIAKMQSFGAHIEMVHHPDANGGYLLSRLAHVRELCSLNKNYVWTNQYVNTANPRIHYMSTGPEIYLQMKKNVDIIFAPVSTGGTLAGIGRYIREMAPSACIIGVDAYGSAVFGTPPASRKLTGIGSSRSSNFITQDLYDNYILVRDEEAFAFCHALYAKTGLKLGGSSGCVLFACAHYLTDHPNLTNVVCVCADDGDNYNATIFNDAWIQRQTSTPFTEQLQAALEIIQP